MIETLSLFRLLNQKLISLLNTLSKDDWNKRTVAGNWTVKDVAAHLLDGNFRGISLYRDGFVQTPDINIYGYSDLVRYLNQLNGDWVKAMKRVSSDQIISLLAETHSDYLITLEKLDLDAPAVFNVAWAGEDISANWFHIAREYTEKWHHQQQIRTAVDQPGILTKKLYKPVLDTFMRALPFKYKDVDASIGTSIQVLIDSEAGGNWLLIKGEAQWHLTEKRIQNADVTINLPVDLSWRLFTKAILYNDVKGYVSIEGNSSLALPALNMIAVMA